MLAIYVPVDTFGEMLVLPSTPYLCTRYQGSGPACWSHTTVNPIKYRLLQTHTHSRPLCISYSWQQTAQP